MGDKGEDLPDELPLSAGSPLPSELDLSQGDASTTAAQWAPDMLPLSQTSVEEGQIVVPSDTTRDIGVEVAARGVGATVAPASRSSENPPEEAPPSVERSLLSRRGRKDLLMLEAFRDAQVLAAESVQQLCAVGGQRAADGDGPREPRVSKRDNRAHLRLANVDCGPQGDLGPVCIDGYRVSSPLEIPLSTASEAAREPGATLDEDVRAIGKHYMQEQVMAITSKRTVYEKLGVGDKKLDRAMPRLACALLHMDHMQRKRVEYAVTEAFPAQALALYVDFVAYDETPLPVQLRSKHAPKAELLLGGPTTVLPTTSESQSVAESQSALNLGQMCQVLQVADRGGSQRILQHSQTGGMLMSWKGQYWMVVLPALSSLAVMERGTANVLQACNERLSSATRVCQRFEQRVRAVCTDQCSANIACEKAMAAARGATEGSAIHILCDIHRTSLVHTKTLALLDDNVRGMIRCALALRTGNTMNTFRQCLKEEVASRLQILHGRPSADAKAYKQVAMRLFASNGRSVVLRRVLLSMCPNGDWREHRVQYYLPAGATVDEPAIREHLTNGLLTALCATRPELYPRSRWTGCDLATDDLGIVESCHHLLSTTFARMVTKFSTNAERPLPENAKGDFEAAAAPGTLEAPECQGSMADGDIVIPEVASGAGDIVPWSEEGGPSRGQAPEWAKVNAAYRRDAAHWLKKMPFGHMVLQRLLLEPLRTLLHGQFAVASQRWEQQQRCKAAKALKAGETDWAKQRQFRLAMAASCQQERRLFQQVGVLWASPCMWQLVPHDDWTISFRSLSFRSLSRLSCVAYQLLLVPHESFPVRMFALLEKADLASEMSAVPDCMLDAWSRHMRAQHPGLQDDLFRHKLLLVAMLAWNDTSVIEARHASVRRMLYIASTQTHPQAFDELAAQWVFLQARCRKASAGVVQVSGKKRTAKSAKMSQQEKIGKVKKKARFVCMCDMGGCVDEGAHSCRVNFDICLSQSNSKPLS